MTTREIWHEVLIKASPGELFRAVSEVHQLAHWWTTDTRGESIVGKNLEFWFGGHCGAVMKVAALQPDELVRWHVTDGGSPDWLGTEIDFQILQRYDQTFLHFRHSKWREDAKTFPHCSMGWAIFLLSLKEFAESGKGRPYPYDMPVNMWSPPH